MRRQRALWLVVLTAALVVLLALGFALVQQIPPDAKGSASIYPAAARSPAGPGFTV